MVDPLDLLFPAESFEQEAPPVPDSNELTNLVARFNELQKRIAERQVQTEDKTASPKELIAQTLIAALPALVGATIGGRKAGFAGFQGTLVANETLQKQLAIEREREDKASEGKAKLDSLQLNSLLAEITGRAKEDRSEGRQIRVNKEKAKEEALNRESPADKLFLEASSVSVKEKVKNTEDLLKSSFDSAIQIGGLLDEIKQFRKDNKVGKESTLQAVIRNAKARLTSNLPESAILRRHSQITIDAIKLASGLQTNAVEREAIKEINALTITSSLETVERVMNNALNLIEKRLQNQQQGVLSALGGRHLLGVTDAVLPRTSPSRNLFTVEDPENPPTESPNLINTDQLRLDNFTKALEASKNKRSNP